MIDESNPAGRLHKILSTAKRQQDTKKVRETWSAVLDIKDDDVEITKGVVGLYSLSQEIQALIKMDVNLNHQLYLSSFRMIDRSFFPLNLDTTWKAAKSQLTDEALTRLQFCAEELTHFYSEESLSEEDLKDIINKNEQLFDVLYKSSLPDALRLGLLEEVERIRNAISLYKIKGAKGLKEALQGTIGAVVVNQEELEKNSKANTDVIKRLGNLIDKLDSFTSRALKIKRLLTKPGIFFLEWFTDPEEEVDNDED